MIPQNIIIKAPSKSSPTKRNLNQPITSNAKPIQPDIRKLNQNQITRYTITRRRVSKQISQGFSRSPWQQT
ncbi:hypothetical protein CEXT_523551 [Caerostris extrusa]|uniref:Uncharacterized protein n=1 Tax=Caerostris extrusa TaxID=172846 RepID=A0AAV4T6B2_CAEEX|nr:hypothetical protein CEXT_523551 [Caerostris extrusa]